jgi:hypothetical protein
MTENQPTQGEFQPLADNVLVAVFAGLSLAGARVRDDSSSPAMAAVAVDDAEALLEELKKRGYADVADVVAAMEGRPAAEADLTELALEPLDCQRIARVLRQYASRHRDVIELLEIGAAGRGARIRGAE